jgi:hypothetical protein
MAHSTASRFARNVTTRHRIDITSPGRIECAKVELDDGRQNQYCLA